MVGGKRRWQGHGFVTLLDMDRLRPVKPAMVRAIVLHEYCHYLLKPDRPAADSPSSIEPLTATEMAGYRVLHDAVRERKPWHGHGAAFIWVMCAVWLRSHERGSPLCGLDILAAGGAYGLSPVADYVVRAEADLAQLAGVPLEDIARRPVPESVQRLFEADTSRK